MREMTVSELARRVGTTADTIRYYERIGILPDADRSPAGYRLFGDDHAERVVFVRRAQRFGLRLDEIADLLEIRERGLCPCGHARDLLADKLAEIDEQMEALVRLRHDIRQIVEGGAEAGSAGPWPCSGPVRIEPPERRTP